MLMLTLLFSALSPCALADSEELSPPELQSAAAIVIDMDTGRHRILVGMIQNFLRRL